MQKVLALLFLINISISALAQNGSIHGVVTDASTGEAMIGANVVIAGTQTGAPTDVEGKFALNNIKPGSYTLLVTFVTYKTDTISNVVVEAGKTTTINSSLREEAKELQEVVVRGQADRTSETTLLSDRKNSVVMVQGIGAQELSRKGVSDAEAAIVQITGVTKQEGVKNVFVRGLGDRYNSTSLNGLPLPSEDPQFKNITLDLFSSDVISSIDVNKTFNADMFGDVAGANIDIKSKKLFEDQELKISLSTGVNSQTVGKDFYRGDGTNFLGTSSREIPISNLNKYDFDHSFKPTKVTVPMLNSGFSVSGGKSFLIGSRELRVFGVGALNSEYFHKTGVERQLTETGGIRQDYGMEKFEYNTSQLAMGNFSYDLGSDNSISYNVIYIHDNKQSVADYTGFSSKGNDDITDPNAHQTFVRRQQQNNNSIFVNQLLSQLKLNDRFDLDLGASFNVAKGDEPDRRSNFYIFDGTNYRINSSSPSYNHRFYSFLKEEEIAARAVVSYSLKENSNSKISVGYNLRSTNRDFEATQFNFDFAAQSIVDPNNPDALFNQASLDAGIYDLITGRGSNPATAFDPMYYKGERLIHSGFVNAVVEVSPVFTVNVGLRVENFNQRIEWDTNLPDGDPVERNKNYFLPSLNLKYDLTKKDIVRLASSQTYTFAQFKELAPFLYEDINFASFGNPYMKPSENLNVDLRYEHYFSDVELVSLTGFYKSVKYPINRALVTSAANEFSYVNSTSDAADIFGAEVELRKELFNLSRGNGNSKLDFGVSVSYLYSNQKLEDVAWDKLTFTPTNAESALEGASAWLVNSDLTYTLQGASGNKLTATVLLNYNTDRIYTLGAPGQGNGNGNQDIVEMQIPKLDFIAGYDINEHFNINLKVKNMLNPDYKKTKDVSPAPGETRVETISNYKRGITTNLGISYKF